MKKPIIGIASISTYKTTDNIFEDRYYILNNYINPIHKNGGVPIGILYNNEEIINESLALCDGFVITGGTRIIDAHFKIIKYALQNKKPILGICMGMQAIATYFLHTKDAISKVEEEIVLIENNKYHYMDNPPRDNKGLTAHNVIINKQSRLYEILKKEKIRVNSLHKYQVKNVSPYLLISAKSEDNIIEAIELKDPNLFVIGVQWHPELLDSMNNIFEQFIKACML